MHVPLARPRLPDLRTTDVVVAGGCFAGVAAALAFARSGHRVALIEQRTYLGREVTATLRPWIVVGTAEERLPEPVQACVEATGVDARPGEVPLQPDAVKTTLEDLLLAAGVELFYACLPVGLVQEAGGLRGLIVGNKSGRQVIACHTVVDATETAVVARVVGAAFEHALPGLSRFSRTLEFDGVRPLTQACLLVPAALEVVDDAVTLHRGYHNLGHVLVECRLALPCDGLGLAGAMRRECLARHRTMRLASYLIQEVPAFNQALLASASCELHGPQTPRLAGPPPDWAAHLHGMQLSTIDGGPTGEALPLTAFAGPAPSLWCLNEAARLAPAASELFREPVAAARLGNALAQAVCAHWDRALGTLTAAPAALPLPGGEGHARSHRDHRGAGSDATVVRDRDEGILSPALAAVAYTPEATSGLEVKEPDCPQRGRHYNRRLVPEVAVPVLRTADVLVVGGGTSGATAAATAAREGVQTVLLELNPGLGGTGTVGGIDSYWFGRRVAYAARVTRAVEEVHRSLNYEGHRWNIEAKAFALLREAERAGVDVYWNVVVIGTVVAGQRVRGVVVATRFGLYAVLAEVVIDATGDGDVAAFAGAEYVYGSARDHVVLYYSFSPYARPGRTLNIKTSMVDISNVEDYTRAILAGRRRHDPAAIERAATAAAAPPGACGQRPPQPSHDHSVYLAPRETRHILGDVVLTLTDQLLHRCWPDVVNVHYSNHDIKGKSGAEWVNIGLIPPHLEAEVPYRALVPKVLESILVAGKAFSATHDAIATIRMQADLENLGGVVGLAAAMAVRAGCLPRHIDVAALQRRLVEEGLLPDDILTRILEPRRCTGAELETLVDSLRADRPLHAYSDMEMGEVYQELIPLVEVCTVGPGVVPVLERALATARGRRRLLMAQALAFYGSGAAVPVLIDEIDRALAGGALPIREVHIRHAGWPPDQGAMPDAAYLLYSLGQCRDRRSLPIWAQVVELLQPTAEDFLDRHKGTFYYVDAVCFGAERLGDPAAVPILRQLHRHPPLRNLVARAAFQPDIFLERRALLELAIGRALARCAAAEGLEVLIAYLADSRAILAEQAHAELVAVTGQDFGKEGQAWAKWLVGARHTLRPCPYREQLDMPAEDEAIFRPTAERDGRWSAAGPAAAAAPAPALR